MNKPYISTKTSYRHGCWLVCNSVPHSSNRVVSFATASTTSHFPLEMYILVSGACKATLVFSCILIIIIFFILPHRFRRATPPAAFVTDPRVRRQNVRLIREWCGMTFIRDRGYDICPRGKKPAEKSHRLNIAMNFDHS